MVLKMNNRFKDSPLFNKLPYFPGDPSGYFTGLDNSGLRVYKKAEISALDRCATILLDNDYIEVQRRNIDEISFAAFKKEDLCVFLLFDKASDELRITAAENQILPCLLPESCTENSDTVFYAFENDRTLIDCGMCLLIQCPDHSFFIVDSGHYFQPNDNDRIYRFMRERTPSDLKVTVCGWLITHGHTDHVSKLMDYLRYNTDDTVIEGFYHNLLTPDYAIWDGNHEEAQTAEKLLKMISDYPAPVYILHTGMKFYVRNLSFEVLSTHEDLHPEFINDYNDTSVVVMLEVSGSKVFIPGDASVSVSRKLESRFANSLKCDIVQVSHHGHTGLSEKCYELLSADLAVFPVTRIMFEQDLPRHSANRKLIDSANQYFITGDGTVCIPLPYDRATVTKLPGETFEDFAKIKRLWKYDYSSDYKTYIYKTFIENGGDPEKLLLPTSPEGWIEPK